MQTPEQIARDIIVREYGEIEITRTCVLVDGARLVELIAAGIKAADDRRRYRVTIEYVPNRREAHAHHRPRGWRVDRRGSDPRG